jgi:predicted DNA-binding transcriptional regulator AlpA
MATTEMTTPPVAAYDAERIAAMLLCSLRQVRRMQDFGMMPRPFRIGRLVRWPAGAIDEWIEAGCPDCRKRSATTRNDSNRS